MIHYLTYKYHTKKPLDCRRADGFNIRLTNFRIVSCGEEIATFKIAL